jgi:hypothetical protein
MTTEERLLMLEQRVAQLEGRIAQLESRGMFYGPVTPPSYPSPYVPPAVWPNVPPFTITCKMADGTTKDMTFTTPIVAQSNT